ncbi:MAG TPA: hypothetical protein PKA64_07720 [Myxococcota bacterium]|nr:hypothetical protein [Myxococcota bacterium]
MIVWLHLLLACVSTSEMRSPPPRDSAGSWDTGGVDDTAALCYDTAARDGCVPPEPPHAIAAHAGAPGEARRDRVTCWSLSRAPDVDGLAVIAVGMDSGAVEAEVVVGEGRVPAGWYTRSIVRTGGQIRAIGRWGAERRLIRVDTQADRFVVGPPIRGFELTQVGAEAFLSRARRVETYAAPQDLVAARPARVVSALGARLGTDRHHLLASPGGWRLDPISLAPIDRVRLKYSRALPEAFHGAAGKIFGLYDVHMWRDHGPRITVHDAAGGDMLRNVTLGRRFTLPGVGEVTLSGLWCE